MNILITLVTILPIVIATSIPPALLPVTPPPYSAACTTKNCIISYLSLDDSYFATIYDEEKPEILLVKFQSCTMDRLPRQFFEIFPMVVYLIITSPGLKLLDSKTFNGASELQSVNLQGNKIEILPSNAFNGSQNLNEIDLSDNQIQVISDDAFADLTYLEDLNLSGNKLNYINIETFKPLHMLSNLNLAGNAIEQVDGRLFIENENLMAVNLGDNHIKTLSHGFAKLLPQIKSLSLMNNPCTVGTMLEKFPIIKLLSGKLDRKALKALKRCYQDYQDPESTDLFDLIENIREDDEAAIVTDLTQRLNEKDDQIADYEARIKTDRAVLISFLILTVFICSIPYILRAEIVRSEKIKEIKVEDKETKVYQIDPNQIIPQIYTIQIQ